MDNNTALSENKYLLITGCSDKKKWYSKRIGEIFPNPIHNMAGGGWTVRTGERNHGFVNKEDAIPVTLHWIDGFVYATSDEEVVKGDLTVVQGKLEYSVGIPLYNERKAVATNRPSVLADTSAIELKGDIPDPPKEEHIPSAAQTVDSSPKPKDNSQYPKGLAEPHIEEMIGKMWEKSNAVLDGVNPYAYRQGALNMYEALKVPQDVEDKWLKFMEDEKTAIGMSNHKTIDRLIWYWNTYFKK